MSTSEVTVLVEKATSSLLIGPDWTLNIEICDLINLHQWLTKSVVKTVKKRLQHKKPRVQFLTLTLLETMVKNCGDFLHSQIEERQILEEMVKLARKRTDTPVRDKVLVLLDSWQEAFGGAQGKHPQYYWAYAELRKSGMHFPKRSGDSALIFTPPAPQQPTMSMPSNSSMRHEQTMVSEMGKSSLSELDAIQGIMELLNDMLQAVSPNDRDAVKDEVIVDLVSQCRSNQKKIIDMINSTGHEEQLSQCLALNDNLQYLIAKHDAIASGSPLIKASVSIPRATVSQTMESESEQFEAEKEEDDGFAQLASRISKVEPDPSEMTSAEMMSSNFIDFTTVGTSTKGTEASPSPSNALVLVDQPTMSIAAKDIEQDLVDLLSLALTSNPSPPHNPSPSTSFGNGSMVPVSPVIQEQPFNHQQFPVSQNYLTFNNYVAPWAQQTPPQPVWQPQSQFQQFPLGYPSLSETNNFTSPMFQQSAPFTTMATGYPPSVHASRPVMMYNSFNQGAKTPLASMQSQHQNSFVSKGDNLQGMIRETQQNVNVNPPGAATASKPFVLPHQLFEDLVDLRNADGTIKTKKNASSLSGPSSQSMISSRK